MVWEALRVNQEGLPASGELTSTLTTQPVHVLLSVGSMLVWAGCSFSSYFIKPTSLMGHWPIESIRNNDVKIQFMKIRVVTQQCFETNFTKCMNCLCLIAVPYSTSRSFQDLESHNLMHTHKYTYTCATQYPVCFIGKRDYPNIETIPI